MRKIGYFKHKLKYVKEGIYEYVIHNKNSIGIINPVGPNGKFGWVADNEFLMDIGFKYGERGTWISPNDYEITPLSPAMKLLYGINEDDKEEKHGS